MTHHSFLFFIRPVVFVVSFLSCLLSVLTLTPPLVHFFLLDSLGVVEPFLNSFLIIFFISFSFFLATYDQKIDHLTLQQMFLLTTLAWFILSFFGGLPFYFLSPEQGLIKAWFHGASFLTTTSYEFLKEAPKTFILWQSILGWFGGVGIIVMAFGLFPALKIGGMQLLQSEFSDRSEKILPKVSEISLYIVKVYTFFTVSCFLGLYIFGLSPFKSFYHALSLLSSNGLTVDYPTRSCQLVACFFMVIGSTPFMLYFKIANRHYASFFQDPQLKTYAMVLVISFSLIYLNEVIIGSKAHISILDLLFNVTSLASTTGLVRDTNDLSNGSLFILFILSLLGGCIGSTAGGLKMFRIRILYLLAKSHFDSLKKPHGIHFVKYDEAKVAPHIVSSVFCYIILYISSVVTLSYLLINEGASLPSSLYTILGCIGNLGVPNLGSLGAQQILLTDRTQIFLIFAMILGRLEMIPVLFLMIPSFWKR